MPLFDGTFVENKPIPFPDRNGSQAYSNLFYWAHLEAFETSEFPLHPHEGFEIFTFVFEGSVEHFDTATKIWTPLQSGGVQAIQANSGISHSERISKGTRLFQIWFDPDFSKTLLLPASYQDYPNSELQEQHQNSAEILTYMAPIAPITHLTQGITVKKIKLLHEQHQLQANHASTYSFYLLQGCVDINGNKLLKDSFMVFDNEETFTFLNAINAEIFIIETPTRITYKRYIDRR